MTRLRDRPVGDIVILSLAIAISIVLVVDGLVILWVFMTQPERDVAGAAAGVADLITSTVAALVGYLAGTRAAPTGGNNVVPPA